MDNETDIAKNDMDVALKRLDKPSQGLLNAVVLLLGVVIALKDFWSRYDIQFIVYWSILAIGAFTILFCVIRCRLYKSIIFISIVLFYCLAWVSAIFEYGFSFGFVFSGFCCTGVAATAICYVVQTVRNPQRLTSLFTAVFTLVNSGICTMALISATRSLFFEVPPQDILLGCMTGNRLCGVGNSNTLASSAASLMLLSGCGLFGSGKKARLLYTASLLLGWFTLGMTGSRTSQIGVSFSVSVMVFSVVLSKMREKSESNNCKFLLLICLKAVALSVLSFALSFLSFSIPTLIFRGALLITAKISNNSFLLNNLLGLSPRDLEDDGTMNGRIQIWTQCIKDCTADVRHFLFGISTENRTWIAIKDGDRVITYIHSHNIVLEWLRKFGVVGTVIWMIPLFYWIRKGVRTLFRGERLEDRFIAASAAGMLVMGIAEVVPYYTGYNCLLVAPFFFICGYCIRINRDRLGRCCETISNEPHVEL